jgi:hypothetical protein
MVEWLIQIFSHLIIIRSSQDLADEEDFEMPKPSERHADALEKDNKFAFLMGVLFLRPVEGVEAVEESEGAEDVVGVEGRKKGWIVPASHRPYQLEERKEDMEFYLAHPYVAENGKSAVSFLKKKKVKVSKPKRIDNGERKERKERVKKVEDVKNFKSAEYIEVWMSIYE